MEDKQKQLNALAYQLHDQLQDATEQFAHDNPDTSVFVVLGAANLYLASLLCHAPDREKAKHKLHKCTKIIEGILDNTPDVYFGFQNSQN